MRQRQEREVRPQQIRLQLVAAAAARVQEEEHARQRNTREPQRREARERGLRQAADGGELRREKRLHQRQIGHDSTNAARRSAARACNISASTAHATNKLLSWPQRQLHKIGYDVSVSAKPSA